MGEVLKPEVNVAGRTEEQERRLRELAERIPTREATEADQEWLGRARLEVARLAVANTAQSPEA